MGIPVRSPRLVPAAIGGHAIVVGAGMAGLAAAAALADSFERVTVLERDALRPDSSPRPGVPQGRQLHGLLAGGLRAFGALFPGFDRDLVRAGAVRLRFGIDDLLEIPGCGPFPRHELGCEGYALSRPLLELTARRRLLRLPSVLLRDRCRVLEIVAADDGRIAGVRCRAAAGLEEVVPADLVVDASARGDLSPGLLRATGWPDLQTTRIGIDITYMTASFAIAGGERDWKLAITYPDRQEDTRIAIVVPIEGQRWMVAVGERYGTIPPADEASFRECLRQLRTPTIHDAIRSAPMVGGVHRFALPESTRGHYERLPGLPDGLLPIGDAICRFNPIYGQGMSVAGIEACMLKDLLRARRGERRPLAGLGQAYIEAVQPVVDAAWSMSAVPDLAHPLARGERPADLEQQLQATMALFRLATRDLEAHRLMVEVRHLLQPLSALRAPDLQRRLELETAA
jgi:2-polyprenyl-6-methoxyphenol hydroxylase-like FAD-dependent oxidoreductase